VRSIIYYHQSLPLYKFKIFGGHAKENLFYSYLYPLYVKLFLNRRTYVAVQTENIKRRFVKRYAFPGERIGVFFPEIEKIDDESLDAYEYENDTINFLYPSMGASYKEHITLAYAMERVYRINAELARRIRIHFTLLKDDNKILSSYINDHQLEENFVFHGSMPHQQVLSMMKSSEGLLFPSVIETLGLPLLEAASLGIPIVANDMSYVHEVLKGYEGVNYVTVHDYQGWADAIGRCCAEKTYFPPYHHSSDGSWPRLLHIIKGQDEGVGRTICVIATASAKRGALAIYNQFVHALSADGDNAEWHVFVDEGMPMPEIPHVQYHVCHVKGFGRIWFDLFGFGLQVKKLGIAPDTIFSLQNTGVRWGGQRS